MPSLDGVGQAVGGADIGSVAFVLSAKNERVHSKSDMQAGKITARKQILRIFTVCYSPSRDAMLLAQERHAPLA
jgi:hypothetical protein